MSSILGVGLDIQPAAGWCWREMTLDSPVDTTFSPHMALPVSLEPESGDVESAKAEQKGPRNIFLLPYTAVTEPNISSFLRSRHYFYARENILRHVNCATI